MVQASRCLILLITKKLTLNLVLKKQAVDFRTSKIMVLFSITTGAAIGIVIDVFKTHDIKLARQLYKFLNPGDIALGDRAFCAYSDIYFLQSRSL